MGVDEGRAAPVDGGDQGLGEVLDRLAAAVVAGEAPDVDLLGAVGRCGPTLEGLAGEAGDGEPYSRRILRADGTVEVMVARWRPGGRCAPHDHGGSRGLVVAVTGAYDEQRYAWDGPKLIPTADLAHAAGTAFRFGAEVVHDMVAAEPGLTLHVYAPPPTHLRVFDLDREEVLDLVGDHGAWIPEGDHARIPFADATNDDATDDVATDDLAVDDVAAEDASTDDTFSDDDTDDEPEVELEAELDQAVDRHPAGLADPDGGRDHGAGPVIVVAHTTRYRGGSAEFAAAARTMVRELATAHPEAEVVPLALHHKAELTDAFDRLAAEGRTIAQLHVVGHSGMYGPMFGSVDWPEQFSPHEWRTMAIPFAADGRAWFHACRTARWFAPFFARTFGVPTYGNQDYTTVSARKDRFAWAGRRPEAAPELYLVAVPGKKSHGWAGSIRKYRGATVEPMIESRPAPPDGTTSYDRVAELYDAAYVDIRVREAEWAWVERHADEARTVLGRPLRVLEVGCGNGALLRALDDRGDLAHAVGLDDSAAMVERARARSLDRERLTFDRIDGPMIDLPDDHVDVVLSFLSFRYLDWDPLMDEIRRVLVPGGRLWVVDMVAKPVGARDLPLLARSTLTHVRRPRRHPRFASDLAALTSHPDWKTMVRHNPIRAEHEYRWYLESRFPGRRLEVLTATTTQRVVAFDSGPLPKGRSAPLSYP